MAGVLQDLRFALRMLRKHPAHGFGVALTLALGIGANTAIFSVVDAVLFRPLPLPHPEQVVTLSTHPPAQPAERYPSSFPDFEDYQRESRSFSGLAAYAYNRFLLSGGQGADYVRGAFVTPGFFPLLGVAPAAGRPLGESDDRAWSVVLGHGLWMRRYHGDPSVIGKSLEVNGQSCTIVGVMPESFRFPTPDVELWASFATIYQESGNPTVGDWIHNRSMRGYRVLGRLAPGVPMKRAQGELEGLAVRLARQYPDADADLRVTLDPLQARLVGPVRPALLTLLGAVAFILLIACVNVANLLLASTAGRGRELALRLALGASRLRLVRQLLTETIVYALVGGGLGVLSSVWIVELLVRLSPGDIPRLEGVGVDGRVLAFAAAASLLAGALTSLAPILQARRGALAGSLHEADRHATASPAQRRIGALLIAGEVALALVLLVGAGLMIRSFTSLTQADPGFDPDPLLTMNVPLVVERYPQPAQQVAYFDELLRRISAVPGVVATGASTSLPPNVMQRSDSYRVIGEPARAAGEDRSALYVPMTPDYLRALGIPLLAGRPLSGSDGRDQAPVALINGTLARLTFAGRDPIGRRIEVGGMERTIVGVVGDTKYEGLDAPAGAQIYVPYAQSPYPGMRVVVRVSGNPAALIGAVRAAAASVDPAQGPIELRPMRELLSGSIARPRFYAALMALFGALALSLAALGVYGVVAHSVSGRTREIGIRLALGAKPKDVRRLVLVETLVPILGGWALGLAGALSLSGAISSLLYGVAPGDPATLAATSLLLLGAALLATLLPALRAARVDPISALRLD